MWKMARVMAVNAISIANTEKDKFIIIRELPSIAQNIFSKENGDQESSIYKSFAVKNIFTSRAAAESNSVVGFLLLLRKLTFVSSHGIFTFLHLWIKYKLILNFDEIW